MQPTGREFMRIQTAYGRRPRDHRARGARERKAIELELVADDRPLGWDDAGCPDCGSSACPGNPDEPFDAGETRLLEQIAARLAV